MARTSGSDDLYKLIHSLTPEEKGYFKKFAGRHSSKGSTYEKIFDDIAEQARFEEASLKKKYKNYAVQKVQLFDAIMESLMVYQKDSEQNNLYYSAIYFQILFRKNLMNKAEQVAKKAQDIAAAQEKFAMQIQFLEFKLNMGKRIWGKDEWKENYLSLYNEIQDVRKKESNREKYMHIHHLLFNEQSKSHREISYKFDPDREIDIAFLKDKKNSLSTSSDRVRLSSLAKYYQLTNDNESFCKVYEEFYKFESSLLKTKSALFDKALLSGAIRGLLAAYMWVGRDKEAKSIFDRDWKFGNKAGEDVFDNYILGVKFDSHENYVHYCQFYALLYCANRDLDGLGFILREEPKLMSLKERFLGPYMDIWKCKVLFEFFAGHLREAMLSINELEAKKENPGQYKDCQWMKILVQLKLKNFSVVNNMSSNFFKNKKIHHFSESESKSLQLLKKVNGTNRKEVLKKIKEINERSADPVNLLGTMDLTEAIAWL